MDDGDAGLDAEGIERYARHLTLEDVGPEGQQQLRSGSVLVVGAGGLGCPVLQYLGAAGVGRIGIVDDDVVERSNLQRQVIYREDDLGERKAEVAATAIRQRNPDVTVMVHASQFDVDAADIVEDYDVVVDATDDVPTRFLLNDACRLAGVPLVHGAIERFHGQVTAFAPGGPCYRCLFPEAPPDDAVLDCATAGVLGVLPGTIGSIQATEVIGHLIGVGEDLVGRLLVYDARNQTVESVPIAPDETCPCCGPEAEFDSLDGIDYEGNCTV